MPRHRGHLESPIPASCKMRGWLQPALVLGGSQGLQPAARARLADRGREVVANGPLRQVEPGPDLGAVPPSRAAASTSRSRSDRELVPSTRAVAARPGCGERAAGVVPRRAGPIHAGNPARGAEGARGRTGRACRSRCGNGARPESGPAAWRARLYLDAAREAGGAAEAILGQVDAQPPRGLPAMKQLKASATKAARTRPRPGIWTLASQQRGIIRGTNCPGRSRLLGSLAGLLTPGSGG
jgi:hypothetical protein